MIVPANVVAQLFSRVTSIPAPGGKGYEDIAGTDCMIFDGNANRYGSFPIDGTGYAAHKVACELAIGRPIKPEEITRHRCDRPGCCNPQHLLPGTPYENYADALERNRNPAFGKKNGAYTHPENRPRGLRRYGRVLPETDVSQIKGALEHHEDPSRSVFIGIAAHFETTPDRVEAIFRGEAFEAVGIADFSKVIQPLEFESLSIPYPERRTMKVTELEVALMRWAHFTAPDQKKRSVKKQMMTRYKISALSLRNILIRKTHRDVAPEIPVVLEEGSGVAKVHDLDVQAIRATWENYPELQGLGLAAALARLFGFSQPTIDRIKDRETHAHVKDDPLAVISLDRIPFLKLHKCGEEHSQSVLNEYWVREIRRLKKEEKLTNEKIVMVLRENGVVVTKETVGNAATGRTWKHLDSRDV